DARDALAPRKSFRHRVARLRSPGCQRLQDLGRTHSVPPLMLDLSKYQSIGEALRDALDQFSNEVCLIEADRERENERLTYSDFNGARIHSRKLCRTAASPPERAPVSS